MASIRHALTALPGVADVALSLPEKQVEVRFDENRLTADAIRTALQSAGYDVAAAPAKDEHRGPCCCS
jgi:copper chaperone CopZ